MHASVGGVVCRGVPGMNSVMIGAVPALCENAPFIQAKAMRLRCARGRTRPFFTARRSVSGASSKALVQRAYLSLVRTATVGADLRVNSGPRSWMARGCPDQTCHQCPAGGLGFVRNRPRPGCHSVISAPVAPGAQSCVPCHTQ